MGVVQDERSDITTNWESVEFLTSYYADSKRNTTHGRKAFWEEVTEENDKRCDFEFDNGSGTSIHDKRGVGVEKRIFSVHTTQHYAHYCN
jgi:hypothetical protein